MQKMDNPRIGGLIVKDKKLLLVGRSHIYWTPGGKANPGETSRQTLERELKEELGISLLSMRWFLTLYETRIKTGMRRKKTYYLITYNGEPTPSHEIKSMKWFAREDIKNREFKLLGGSRIVIKRLMAKGLI